MDAYNRQNEEDDFQSEYDKETQKLIEKRQSINIAMKDTSLAGKKNLADLQKAYEEQKQKLEDMQKEHDRELQNQWFDDEMAKIEVEKAKAVEEFDNEFDDKAIAGMVAELIGNGFTKIGEDLIDLSQLMEEHFEGTFSMLGDKLKSDFLDTLKEAREVAVSINDIFKEIGVNADLSRVNDGVYGTSKASSRVVSEISKTTAMALNDGIATYLAKGIARTPMEGNNGVSIGSLLSVAGSIDRDTFPSVEKLVNQAVEKMQGMMKSNFRIGTGRI